MCMEASEKGGHYTICSNRRFLPYVYRSELRQIFLFLMEPSAMRVDHFQRDFRIIVLACALVLTSVSAFAQSGQLRFDSTTLAAAAQNAAQQSTEIVRRLTMDEAVKLALEQNLGIRIQRLDPQISDVGVMQARSFWAPNLTSTFSRNAQTQQPTNALAGGATNILNANVQTNLGMNQFLPWGGSYSATWNSSRATSTSNFAGFSPQLGSNLNFQYSQPLLRNFEIDQIRQQVQTSKKARDLSDIQLVGVVTGTLRSVKNAYWDLVYAISNLKAQQQSLTLSQQSLK